MCNDVGHPQQKGYGKSRKGKVKEKDSKHKDGLLFKQILNKFKHLDMEKKWVKTRAGEYFFQLCRLRTIDDNFGIFRAKEKQ